MTVILLANNWRKIKTEFISLWLWLTRITKTIYCIQITFIGNNQFELINVNLFGEVCTLIFSTETAALKFEHFRSRIYIYIYIYCGAILAGLNFGEAFWGQSRLWGQEILRTTSLFVFQDWLLCSIVLDSLEFQLCALQLLILCLISLYFGVFKFFTK